MITLARLDRAPMIVAQEITTQLAEDVEIRISEIWGCGQELHEAAKYDGTLYSVVSRDEDRWNCQKVPYRWFYAQRREPSLFAPTNIRLLAITGIITCDNGFLVGQRANNVEQDKGLWELLPAGGIDEQAINPDGSIDPVTGLWSEWEEETGCPASYIGSKPKILAFVENHEDHVIDLVLLAHCTQPFEVILEQFENTSSGEYTKISCLTQKQILEESIGHFADVTKLIASELLNL